MDRKAKPRERIVANGAANGKPNNTKNKPASGKGCCAQTYTLKNWYTIPNYLKHNKHIVGGYRADLTLRQALTSLFHIHNDLLGFIFFLVVLILGLCTWVSDAQPIDKAVFVIYCLSAMTMMACSTLFHLLGCCGSKVYDITAKFDYTGIAVLIVGSYYGPLWYVLGEDYPYWALFYVSVITFLGGLSVYSVWSSRMHRAGSELLRLGVFLSLGCFGALPLPHIIGLVGWEVGWPVVKRLLIMGAFYIGGSVIYGSQIPERFWPGKFDIWLQSHSIWHCFVLAGAIQQWHNIEYAYWWRRCRLSPSEMLICKLWDSPDFF